MAFLLLLLSTGNHCPAQERIYTKTIPDPLNTPALIFNPSGPPATVTDPVYADPALRVLIGPVQKMQNVVRLKINEEAAAIIASDFNVKVTVSITKTPLGGGSALPPITRILELDYRLGMGQKSDAVSYYADDNGGYQLSVQITHIEKNVTWDVTGLLQLVSEIRSSYDAPFLHSIPISLLSNEPLSTPRYDELEIQWSYPGTLSGSGTTFNNYPTDYDIEWAWIEALAAPQYTTGGNWDPAKIFLHNATRVTVPVSYDRYRIPLLYDGSGKLFYRVRPLQKRTDGQIIHGNWTSSLSENAGMFTLALGHEEALNWQASTSFAEDGKRKTVIQYFDGSLRGRQTVTKDNSQSNPSTVVAETFYDFQGRPTIQVLPSPTLNNIIGFTKNFNNNSQDGNGYPKEIYDLLQSGQVACNSGAPALSRTVRPDLGDGSIGANGAGNYYSSNNPLVNSGFHQFIPEANGFAFTETRYAQDATGRVLAQSGVGPTHQLGSGHETKYFYSSPTQEELDLLFGTDAGIASHYEKNMVQDANGQFSVSYVDMHGRTVATALAGNAPANLETLPSLAGITAANLPPVTQQLLNEATNVVDGRRIVMVRELLVTTPGIRNFEYKLDPQQLLLKNCTNQNICYDCLYDLTITITNNCSNGAPLFTRTVRNFSLPYNSVCGTAPAVFHELFSVNFQETGAYTLTKTLTLSSEAQEQFRTSALQPGQLVCKTQLDFYNEIKDYMLSQNANCQPSCATCTAALGTYPAFEAAYAVKAQLSPEQVLEYREVLQAAYAQAVADCNAICENGSDRVNNYRDILLLDMMPDQGQYARILRDDLVDPNGQPITADITSGSFNIFGKGWFRAPKNQQGIVIPAYLDEFGHPDPSSPDNLGTINYQDFSSLFKESWANQLLSYHPEYKKLLLVESDPVKAAFRWQEQWQEKTAWTSEVAAMAAGLPGSDPFYTTVLAGSPIQAQMLDRLSNGVKILTQTGTSNFTTYSMWKFALGAVKCKNESPANQQSCLNAITINTIGSFPSEISCQSDKDMVWRVFSALYFSAREKFLYDYLQATAPVSPSIFDAPPAGSYLLRYQPRFINPELSTMGTEVPSQLQALFAEATNPDQHTNSQSAAALEAEYEDNCRSYVNRWMEQVAPFNVCKTNIPPGDIENLMEQLVSICKRGSDLDHPQGSSSVSPTHINQSSPTSFEQAISQFMLNHSIPVSVSCHPYVIDWPKPYDKSPVLDNEEITETNQDQCACTRLTQLENLYSSSFYSGSFLSYLQTVHGIRITPALLTQITDLCKGPAPSCRFLATPIILPPGMQCNSTTQACISCYEYNNYKSAFITAFGDALPSGLQVPVMFPTTPTEEAWNNSFTQFMNSKTGFSKQWNEYAQFEKSCLFASEPITAPAGLCSRFSALISAFNAIPQDPNISTADCQAAFASYFNQQEGSQFSYGQIKFLYSRCQGGTCTDLPLQCIVSSSNYSETIINNTDAFLMTIDGTGQAGNCSGNTSNALSIATPTVETSSSPVVYLDTVAVPNPVIFINSVNIVPDTSIYCSDGSTLFQKTFGGDANELIAHAVRAADNGYVMAGQTSSYGSGSTDGLLIKTNAQGLLLWSRALGGSGADILYRVKKTSDDGFIACGQTKSFGNSAGDAWLVKTDAHGTVQWSKKYGDGNAYGDMAFDVIQLADGGYAFCGSHRYASSHTQSFVVRTDLLGNKVWSKSYGVNDNSDLANGLVQDGSSLVVVGYNQGVTGSSFAEDSSLSEIGNNSYYDSYLMKLNVSNGNIVYTREYDADNRSTWFNKISLADGGYQVHSVVTDDYNNSNVQNYIWSIYPDGTVHHVRKLVIPGTSTSSFGWLAREDGGFITANSASTSTADIIYSSVSPSGTIEWSNTLVVEGQQAIHTITATAGGGYALAGVSNARNILPPVCGEPLPSYLCGLNDPIHQELEIEADNPCDDYLFLATQASIEAYNLYLTRVKNDFDKAYLQKCLAVREIETMTMEAPAEKEYHYTLYYYDQAGNLVQTIPPAGVDNFNNNPNTRDNHLAAVKAARISGATVRPYHSLPTTYRYNTLGLVVEQKSPDGGLSKFWYDELGRLAISQNAKQASNNDYSYTLYDGLGRITQVGQKNSTAGMDQALSRSPEQLTSWLNTGSAKTQITRTVYDVFYGNETTPGLDSRLLVQRNLRNRVSYTQVVPVEPANFQVAENWLAAHSTASFYTYDIHGNVDELLQDYQEGLIYTVDGGSNRFKKMAYTYDLISGKVNTVTYQPDYLTPANELRHHDDRYYHRYDYDAENKLILAQTSPDGIIWEDDARYYYFKHGSLARTVLGQQQVQGIDYGYTLQGWLKGVNSTAISATPTESCAPGTGRDVLDIFNRQQYGQPQNYVARQEINFLPDFLNEVPDDYVAEINPSLAPCIPVIAPTPYITGDMGQDGKAGAPHQWVARDAYSYSLNYYQTGSGGSLVNDYQSISSTQQPFTNTGMFNLQNGDQTPAQVARPLFNGNIASMFVNVPKLGEAHLYGYRYDQLNRIVSMDAFKGFNPATNQWTGAGGLPTASSNYLERISYDANGNILTYLRQGSNSSSPSGSPGGPLPMDQLTYGYNITAGKLVNNRLRHVKDVVPANNYETDIDEQPDDNYGYDAIGNLIRDDQEKISSIEWTVYGKISRIRKGDQSGDPLKELYIDYRYDASGNRISKSVIPVSASSSIQPRYTFYVRDASGNVMAVYEKEGTADLTQTEVHLYGSSRLGLHHVQRKVEHRVTVTNGLYRFVRGEKQFELSNHLGNVLATITDRKLQVDGDNSGTIDYYVADVVTAVDYYPFGMDMPGRKFGNGNRYGFNGKERDKDMNSLTAYDYGFRIYNPAIGKFLSVDPLTSSYPELTPYQYASNTPIWAIDIDGLEGGVTSTGTSSGLGTSSLPASSYPGPGTAAFTNSLATRDWRVANAVNGFIPENYYSNGTHKSNLLDAFGNSYMNHREDYKWHVPSGPTYISSPGYVRPAMSVAEMLGIKPKPQVNMFVSKPPTPPLPQLKVQTKNETGAKFDPTQKPASAGGEQMFYLYETKRDHKQATGIVTEGISLPYFGITGNAFAPGRYHPESIEGSSLVGIIGKANYYTIKGAETALINLNKKGFSSIGLSTRIDNDMVSTLDKFREQAGITWLNSINPNWRKDYLRPTNPAPANSQVNQTNSQEPKKGF